MSELLEAVEAARSFDRQFRGVMLVAKALENIHNLEDAERSLRAKVNDARVVLERTLAEVKQKEDEVKSLKAETEQVNAATVVARKQHEEKLIEYAKLEAEALDKIVNMKKELAALKARLD